ncbi:MAG: hypothetical protein ABI679_14180 [Gemmatimonadota bacterium]
MTAALSYEKHLPEFGTLDEARTQLFVRRDQLLERLSRVDATAAIGLDTTPESLKRLEAWYFTLLPDNHFAEAGLDRDTLEAAIPQYLGAVVVHNLPAFSWLVAEYAFAPGRYEIGITRGLYTVMLTAPADLSARASNQRHQSLWREYKKCAA